MIITPTRYVQKPPEIDALLVTEEAVDAACTWLSEHGRDGYGTGAELHVVGRGQLTGFAVPFGWYLVHGALGDGTTGFGVLHPTEFEARFVAASSAGAHSWKDRL